MTKSELEKYRTALKAREAEIAEALKNREDIAIEKAADAIDAIHHAAMALDDPLAVFTGEGRAGHDSRRLWRQQFLQPHPRLRLPRVGSIRDPVFLQPV